jgi:hypothetical protein
MAVTNKKVPKTAMERNEVLRATWQAAYGRGQCFSVLPALSIDGIIALDIFEGAVKFLIFLREQVV